MGDFSRTTFDRMKHYVGVRLQQAVPIVDADWNELEDIRKYELQAFLKWFVGDGVPAGNDGFRIAPLAGGGVGTIRLASSAAGPGRSSVTVDVGASTAAAALGFTAANRSTGRSGSSPAQLTGDAAAPFALTAGMTLAVSADGAAAETVTFSAGGFATIGAATAAEVVAAVNSAVTRVVASAGTGNDFTVMGGDGTPEGAGRCLVDGRDAVTEGRLAYGSQPLFANSALAAQWGVAVVPPLSPPSTGTRTDLVYLDVWEREVTVVEDDSLVNPLIGVESCVRVRREWAVRVRPGADTVPAARDADFQTGHSYLALAVLSRRAGVVAIGPDDLQDRRQRRLLLPPAHLLTDTLGVDPLGYRRGDGRPPISLREAINALLAGQLPSTPDLAVSPAPGVDVVRRAFMVDAFGGLVTIWQSPRVANTNQIFGSRLDLGQLDAGFSIAQPLSSGTARIEPTAVALPNGDIIVAYQNGLAGAASTDVVMKRAAFAGLAGAAEQPVAATAAADQSPHAVLSGDHVVFFTHQTSTNTWRYRRYGHANAKFLDQDPANPPQLSAVTTTLRDLHAAAVAGGQVWVAFADGTNLQLLRLTPTSGTVDAVASVSAAGILDVFVLGISATEALVFWDDGSALRVIGFSGATWGAATSITGTDANDAQPAAVRDADGTVFLLSARLTAEASNEIFLRRRNPVTAEWGQPQRVISHPANDLRPYPVLVPGQGIWVLWMSDRNGNFDLFAKRLITAI